MRKFTRAFRWLSIFLCFLPVARSQQGVLRPRQIVVREVPPTTQGQGVRIDNPSGVQRVNSGLTANDAGIICLSSDGVTATGTLCLQGQDSAGGMVIQAQGSALNINGSGTVNGQIVLNPGPLSLGGVLINSGHIGIRTVTIKGKAGQTARMFEVQDSTGNRMFHVGGEAAIGMASGAVVARGIFPVDHDTYQLGLDTGFWKSLFVNEITFENDKKILMKDSAALAHTMFHYDSSNNLTIGPTTNAAGDGDVIFYADGNAVAKLTNAQDSTGIPEKSFAPDADRVDNIGGRTALWDEIHGEDLYLGRGTSTTEVQGSLHMYAGTPAFSLATTIQADTLGAIATLSIEWFGGPLVPGSHNSQDIGFDDGTIDRRPRKIYTVDLDVSGDCVGCIELPVVDTTSIVEGSSDPTKEIRFEVDGLTTATVRVLTPQDADYMLAGTNITNEFSVDQKWFNNTKILFKDTAGTAINTIWLDGSNFLHMGTIDAITGDGDVIFYSDGDAVAKLTNAEDSAGVPEKAFAPNADRVDNIGGRTALWDEIHGEDLYLGRGTSATEIQGALHMYAGTAAFPTATTIQADTLGAIATLSIEWFGGPLVPGSHNSQDIGFDDGTIDRRPRKIYTVDLDISGSCTGCGAGGFVQGSIPFADAGGILTEDNANLVWNDAANRLGVGTNSPAAGLHLVTAGDGADQIRITSTGGALSEYFFLSAHSASNYGRLGFWTGAAFGSLVFENKVSVGLGSPADVRFHVGQNVDGSAVLAILENIQAHVAGSLNETAEIRFAFGGDNDVARIVVGKLDDYDPGPAENDSFMDFYTDGNGAPTRRIRLVPSNIEFFDDLILNSDSAHNLFSLSVRPIAIYADAISGRTIEIGPEVGGGAHEFQFRVSTVNFLRLNNSTGAPMFKLDSRVASDFQFIINTNRTRLFAPDANVTLDLEMFAGDAVDDLVRIRLLSSTGLAGWNIVFDQTGAANSFKIQDESGVDYFSMSQNLGVKSFLQPIANQTHIIFFGAGDNVDDDVRVLWQNIDASNGYAILWDQSADLFIIEDHAGTDLFTLNGSGDQILAGDIQYTDPLIISSTAEGQGIQISDNGPGELLPTDNGGLLGSVSKRWDLTANDIIFDGSISGGGTVGMSWVPDGDGTRDSGTSANSWRFVYAENLQVQEADDTTLIELSNTAASATQIRLNDPGGVRRMNIGFFGAGDNDVAISLLGPAAGDNVSVTTADAGGVAAIQIGGDSVLRGRLTAVANSSCTPDATWSANEQNCLTAFVLTMNLILARMRATGGHGFIAD